MSEKWPNWFRKWRWWIYLAMFVGIGIAVYYRPVGGYLQ
jgi:hypothetical protein